MYDPEKRGLQTVFSPLEEKTLRIIWEKKIGRVKDVHRIWGREIPLTTVGATMNRLHRKGFLSRRIVKGRGGLHYEYEARMNEEKLKAHIVTDVMKSLKSNFRGAFIGYLAEECKRDNELKKALR